MTPQMHPIRALVPGLLSLAFLLPAAYPISASATLQADRIDRRYSCPVLFTIPEATIPAKVTAPVAVGRFSIGIGSSMEVEVGKGKLFEGQFLGRLVKKSGESQDLMFFHPAEKRIYLLNLANLKLVDSEGRALGRTAFQPILDPIAQIDEICMGHVGEHLFHQLHLNRHSGEWSEKLAKHLADEEQRSLLFASLANAYYATPRNNSNFGLIMRKKAKDFDLNCKSVEMKKPATKALREEKSAQHIAKMKSVLDQGYPVAIEYFIGPEMKNKPVRVVDVDLPTKADPRIWLPRATGERSYSGHGALIVGYFTPPQGREQFLILDSNWSEPRLFDVENDVRQRIFSSGMLMHYCHP